MKKLMLVFLIMALTGCATQKPVTVVPTDYDISDNLDLEAVASIFGESRDLEEFEQRLNNPKTKISNLDLNEDGYVDYLRVVESVERGIHYIAIQAALGNDLFQDVATIDVERDSSNQPQIQFIGHPYFYGPSYIIQPLYYSTPIIVNSFWGPSYVVWQSPYYFGNYPSYYNYWRPFPVHQYVTNVYVYKNVKNTYKYAPVNRRTAGTSLTRDLSRNDYVAKRPTQTFETRNKDVRNKQDLEARRNTDNTGSRRTSGSTIPREGTRDTRKTEETRKTSTPRTSPSTNERNPTNSPRTRTPNTTPNTRQPGNTPSTRKPSSRNPKESTTPKERRNTKDPKNN